jgi:TorA maturation chaperone TorD
MEEDPFSILGANRQSKSLAVSEHVVFPEEQDRADGYGFLAALLLQPDAQLVSAIAAMPAGEDPSPLGAAWPELIAAAAVGPIAVREEYDALFVAAGTPRLNPYQCHYRAGWLMDKPLARLRDDLRALGLARHAGATELEDHLGVLCETMRVLILSGAAAEVQRDFFSRHVAGWSQRCLRDIATAPGASFYAALARVAAAFLAQEAQELGLDEAPAETNPQRTPDPHAPATA